MANPYDILGVAPTASEEVIRAAYRKLAKKHHPDLNPGNKEAERRFKDIAAAYDLVGDPAKRKRFDAGEIDETGVERPERKFYRQYAGAGPEARPGWQGDGASFEDLGDVFSELFRRRSGDSQGQAWRFSSEGRDARYRLPVDFLEAINGARKRINLPDGRTLDVTIPAGVTEGQRLRLKGMGEPGVGGGAAGDAIVEIAIRPHPEFQREGTTIRSILPVTMKEAIAGAKVRVDTVSGPVDLAIPRASNSGAVLRLKGRGVPDAASGLRGDHLVELKVMLPEHPDAALEKAVSEWEALHPYDPRSSKGGRS